MKPCKLLQYRKATKYELQVIALRETLGRNHPAFSKQTNAVYRMHVELNIFPKLQKIVHEFLSLRIQSVYINGKHYPDMVKLSPKEYRERLAQFKVGTNRKG